MCEKSAMNKITESVMPSESSIHDDDAVLYDKLFFTFFGSVLFFSSFNYIDDALKKYCLNVWPCETLLPQNHSIFTCEIWVKIHFDTFLFGLIALEL